MTHAVDQTTETNASLVWEQLGEHLDRFAVAWQESPAPPTVANFLPAGPPALRRLALVEILKLDLEHRWHDRRAPKLVEEYLAELPELVANGDVPCDLVYEEYHIRKQQGDNVSLSEYCRRFPSRADELRRLIVVDAPTHSTVLNAGSRMPVFEVGESIDDFELLSVLGKGAFATVFRARQKSLLRIVALKVSRDQGFEPQTLAQLEHPNIVRVFDQRQIAEHKLRLLYMQYVAGGTLHDVLSYLREHPSTERNGATLLAAVDAALMRNGESPPSDSMTRYRLQNATWPQVVCWLGARMAAALAHAHQVGVLHRDIKPANVLVGADTQPKLADFNISFSKLDGVTPAAFFGGTLAYMSPEQLEAYNPAHTREPDEVDARSDTYSLGMVLWELLTLVRPFADLAMPADWSLALPAMTALRREGLPAEDRERVPRGCPAGLVEVLTRCLAPDPADRYQSAGELARELDLCLQPRAYSLLHAGTGLRKFARRYPVATTILVGLVPNIVLSALNVVYNWNEIVRHLSEDGQRLFQWQILVVNSTAYTIGLGYVWWTRGRMFLTVERLARGLPVEPPEKWAKSGDHPASVPQSSPGANLVRQCLTLGLATAGITAVLWAISGFSFPIWQRYGTGGLSQLSTERFVHFVVSNMLCGMIAATQSYYVVTALTVRACYPWLLQWRTADGRDMAQLASLLHWGRVFLGLTVAVPFLALAALLAIDVGKEVLGALAALGFVGCAFAYWLDLLIRGDLSALGAAINPGGDPLLGGDSLDSYLTGSRH